MADDIGKELAQFLFYVPAVDGQDNPLSMDEAQDYADKILASPVIARIRAEAWDEGYEGGLDDESMDSRGISSDPGFGVYHDNPYRPASIHSETEKS